MKNKMNLMVVLSEDDTKISLEGVDIIIIPSKNKPFSRVIFNCTLLQKIDFKDLKYLLETFFKFEERDFTENSTIIEPFRKKFQILLKKLKEKFEIKMIKPQILEGNEHFFYQSINICKIRVEKLSDEVKIVSYWTDEKSPISQSNFILGLTTLIKELGIHIPKNKEKSSIIFEIKNLKILKEIFLNFFNEEDFDFQEVFLEITIPSKTTE